METLFRPGFLPVRMACMATERSLESLTAEDFHGTKGSRFKLTGGSSEGGSGETFEAELAEVTEHAASAVPGASRMPFSLVFHGPLEQVHPQGMYRLEHKKFGSVELFLVPIGPNETAPGEKPTAMRYEAVFG